MKRIICLAAAFALLLTACGQKPAASTTAPVDDATSATAAPAGDAAQSGQTVYELGDTVEDFTVTLADGQSVTLSEILRQKKVVVLNFWATWCRYCVMEFPDLQQAAANYSDDVAVLALSVEPTDTAEVVTAFKQENGLDTLPMGQDTTDLHSRFACQGWPTTVVIDRNGTFCLMQVGMVPATAIFENVFEQLTQDDYSGLIFEDGFPNLPTYEPATSAELAAALEAENLDFVAKTNDADQLTFRIVDGQEGLQATMPAYAPVMMDVNFTADAGDVLAFELRVDPKDTNTRLYAFLDDQAVLCYADEQEWISTGFVIPTDGTHTVTLYGTATAGSGAAALQLRNMALLTGADAAAYTLPQGHIPRVLQGEEVQLTFPDDAEQLQITVGGRPLAGSVFYLRGQSGLQITQQLGEEINEQLLDTTILLDDKNETVKVDKLPTNETGAVYDDPLAQSSAAVLLAAYNGSTVCRAFAAQGADEMQALLAECLEYGFLMNAEDTEQQEVVATRADGTELYRYTPEAQTPAAGSAVICCVDEAGAPVAGAMVQVCSGSLCMVFTADEAGTVTVEGDAYPYTVHLLKAPEGYQPPDIEYNLTAPGQELTIELSRAE